MRGRNHARLHAESTGEFPEALRACIGTAFRPSIVPSRFPFDPLEENSGLHVPVLVGMENISAMLEDPARDPRDEARLVGAVQQGG